MEGSEFEEAELFRAVHQSGARALLIGRQALIALGAPVLTGDFDYWLHIDDVNRFNTATAPLGLTPTHSPEAARARGRYVLENDVRVDVLIARVVPTVDGERVAFDDVWARRRTLSMHQVPVLVPAIADLMATKKFGARPKDAEDVRWLRQLLVEENGDE